MEILKGLVHPIYVIMIYQSMFIIIILAEIGFHKKVLQLWNNMRVSL